VFNELAT